MIARYLDAAALREPLRMTLRSRTPSRLPPGATTAAAVLVPLFEREGQVHVWLLRRPTTMRSHGGQVAFPGGKTDAGESPLATALREAEEELGIRDSWVDVLGALDDQLTRTGFTITPWVGWLAPDVVIRPNPSEVARAFAPALRAFLEPSSVVRGREGWTVDGEWVWGATAAILRSLAAVVAPFDSA